MPDTKNIIGLYPRISETINHERIDISAIAKEAEKLLANPFTEKFKSSILDQTKDYPPPVSVINLRQNLEVITFLSLKSFSLWQGKAKSKKTTALALAISSFISRIECTDNIRFERSMDGTVLFFDTEQGQSYAARTMKLILKLAGLSTSPNLVYCDLREFPTKERLQIIQAGIENTPDVKIVVIDGIVDLMEDFMSSQEGHVTMTEIIRLCSVFNIHVAGVLHQNKSKTDKNARAHVGSIASQKCEVEISAEVHPQDKCRSIISCENSRGLPFEPFAIEWQKGPGSLPHICKDIKTATLKEANDTKRQEVSSPIARAIFGDEATLTFTEIIERVMERYDNSKSTAKNWLAKWEELRIVKHDGDKYILDVELPSGLTIVGGSAM